MYTSLMLLLLEVLVLEIGVEVLLLIMRLL